MFAEDLLPYNLLIFIYITKFANARCGSPWEDNRWPNLTKGGH